MRPAKIQISLRSRAVWSESSLAAFCIAKDAKFLHTDNEDTDQTARTIIIIISSSSSSNCSNTTTTTTTTTL